MKSSSSVIRGAGIGPGLTPIRPGSVERSLFTPFPAAPRALPPAEKLAREQELRLAYQKGLQEGQLEAAAEAQGELEGLRTTLDMVVHELWSAREKLREETEQDVIRLGLAVAKKIVGDLAAREESLVEKLVEDALRRTASRDRVTLRVNPEDLSAVREHRERWLSLVEGVNHFEIVEDRRVPRGSAMVTTLEGSVDARWNTQLEEISRQLTGDEPKS